jgi:hypothetical protein
MAPEFPLPVETLVTVLKLAAPTGKHVAKLSHFVESKLPPGFPVKIGKKIAATYLC